MESTYSAAAFQVDVWACRGRDDVGRNVDRLCEMIGSSAVYHYAQYTSPGLEYPAGRGTYAPIRLVSLPEWALNFPAAASEVSIPELRANIAVSIPGPETDRLAEVCRRHGFYLGCGAYEAHPEFPDRIFNSQFLMSPDGDILSVHRKYNPWIPSEFFTTSPHDVFDQYVEVFGRGKSLIETFFPVVDTSIGRIGMLTCNDGFYSENWRALAFQGAEVILHGNFCEPFASEPRGARALVARTNALMQGAYVVEAAVAAKLNHANPKYVSSGSDGVMIVDFEGRVIARAGHPLETMTSAVLNIGELRRKRADPGSMNFLAHIRTEAFRDMYATGIYPANVLSEVPIGDMSEARRRDVVHLGVIDEMFSRRMLSTPFTDGRRLGDAAEAQGPQ